MRKTSLRPSKVVIKQTIIMLLCICILATLAGCSSTSSSGVYRIYNVADIEYISDFTVNSKGEIFIAGDGKIFVYDNDGNDGTTIEIEDYYISTLSLDGDKIVAFDHFHGKIFMLDTAGEVLYENSITFQFEEISKMIKVADAVYILGRERGESNREQRKVLLRYYISSGRESEINIDDINNFSVYDKNSLLLQIGPINSKLIIYNIKNENAGEELTFEDGALTNNYIWDFEYDLKSRSIFYIADKALYSIKVGKNSGRELIDKLYDTARGGKIKLSKQGVFVIDPEAKTLERFGKVPGKNAGSTLAVVTSVGESSIDKEFEKEFGVTVNTLSTFYGDNFENFVAKILSGDTSFDIYELNSNNMNSYNFLRNSFFYDLSHSDIIKDYMDNCFKGIKESSYYEGKLFGLPIWSETSVMFYNQKILDKYNAKAQEIVTWEDFFEVISIIGEDGNAANTFDISKFEVEYHILNQYIYSNNHINNGEIDFRTAEFRKALSLMKRARTSSYLQEPNFNTPRDGIFDEHALSIIGIGAVVEPETNKSFLTIPAIEKEDEIKSNVAVSWLVINPRSKNKDLAVKYLETSCKNVSLTTYHHILGKHEHDGSYVNPSAAWYSNLEKVLESSIVNFQYNIYGVIKPILEDFYIDGISLDEAIETISEKVNMMIME